MTLESRLAAVIAALGPDIKDSKTRLTAAEAKLAAISPSIVLVEGASTAGVANSTVIYFREA